VKAGGKQVLAYSSTLKMEATCSSETSADFHQTTWRYIPEEKSVHFYLTVCLESGHPLIVFRLYRTAGGAISLKNAGSTY
jgi:hypothetical protein